MAGRGGTARAARLQDRHIPARRQHYVGPWDFFSPLFGKLVLCCPEIRQGIQGLFGGRGVNRIRSRGKPGHYLPDYRRNRPIVLHRIETRQIGNELGVLVPFRDEHQPVVSGTTALLQVS